MIWQDEMKRHAVRIAMPDWELRDDDILSLDIGWEDEYDDGSCGDPDCCGGGGEYEPEHFAVIVTAQTADYRHVKSREYKNEQANDFIAKLMRRESAENVNIIDVAQRIAKREALRDIEVRAAEKRLGLATAKQVYDRAMHYASINDRTREVVHDLAQRHGGSPTSIWGGIF